MRRSGCRWPETRDASVTTLSWTTSQSLLNRRFLHRLPPLKDNSKNQRMTLAIFEAEEASTSRVVTFWTIPVEESVDPVVGTTRRTRSRTCSTFWRSCSASLSHHFHFHLSKPFYICEIFYIEEIFVAALSRRLDNDDNDNNMVITHTSSQLKRRNRTTAFR
jgi:hypothetical protein